MKIIRIIICAILISNLVSCVTNSSRNARIDNIPMYGQPEIVRPDFLKKGDEEFIKTVINKFGDRKKASTLWWQQGDSFANEGNLDYAMRRYNQSWLLDPNNYQPYWGFGRVMLQQRKYNESIKYFEKSKILINDNYQKVALLSDYGSVLSFSAKNTTDKNKQNSLYRKAEANFLESIKLDPKYGKTWLQWALSLYQEGNYIESKEKLNKAKSLGESYPKLEEWLQSK